MQIDSVGEEIVSLPFRFVLSFFQVIEESGKRELGIGVFRLQFQYGVIQGFIRLDELLYIDGGVGVSMPCEKRIEILLADLPAHQVDDIVRLLIAEDLLPS